MADSLVRAPYRRVDGVHATPNNGDDDDVPDPYRLGFLELEPSTGFDIDRLWLDELLLGLTSPAFLSLISSLSDMDAGGTHGVGGHELRRGDAIGWHDDARRNQRLGAVYFALDGPVGGGHLEIEPNGSAPQEFAIAPIANRLVIFDATFRHRVEPVTKGFRRTLVARTRR